MSATFTFWTDVDLQQGQLNNAVLQNLAAPPASPVLGQVYFDTTLNTTGEWNGAAWKYLASGTVGKFAANFGDGVAKTATVTHGLSTFDCRSSVVDNATHTEQSFTVSYPTVNTVLISSNKVMALNAFRVTVFG